MKFGADDYYCCSIERMDQARHLLQSDSYSLAIYCSGLAIECMLRAFRWKDDPTFDGRHDLNDLLDASRFMTQHNQLLCRTELDAERSEALSMRMKAALSAIVKVWRNNLRYASEAKLRRYFFETGQLAGIKGDGTRFNAVGLLEAAQFIVNQGSLKWLLSQRSKPR